VTEGEHVALTPSKELLNRAKKRAEPKSARKGEPPFLMTDEMRRLSTPWSVSSIRAEQIDPLVLPAGVILDAAAGSGVQLIAYSKILRRPALGIELDEGVAELCAANMHLNSEGDVQRSLDRVLVGDGSAADSAISAYWVSLREGGTRAHPPIAMLHLDPARPQDAQSHSIDEMKPDLKSVMRAWSKHLQAGPRGPAVLLDLSPRLDSVQRAMVDGVLETCFPGCVRTWEWLSQGGGRVDRLSVWIGSISSRSPRRCLRIGRKRVMASIEGTPATSHAVAFDKPPDYGAWISIIDPALFESGLQESWLNRAITGGTGSSWIRTEGRRPLLIHTDPLAEDKDVRGFVVATGQIAQHRLTPPELHTIDLVASAAASNGIGKITLRCVLEPSLHPTLQRRLDKTLKEVDGDRAFMIDMDLVRGGSGHTLYVVCREQH
tara:strand:- start:2958 stop:4259 length:1302 start_codon:yes stop_codon:yes gene_type:complete